MRENKKYPKKLAFKYRIKRFFRMQKWCGCGDEILINDTICENCRFIKDLM